MEKKEYKREIAIELKNCEIKNLKMNEKKLLDKKMHENEISSE